MPPCSWPGIEQMKGSPAAGIVTVPVVVWPASAATTVPSSNVTSWMIAPVFFSVTS
jgi:hypothetical protein